MNIKKIINNLFEESEEEKNIRLEIEEASTIQDNIIKTMKCPICGGEEFNISLLSSKHSSGSVNELISFYNGFNKKYNINSHMCLNCGYIITMANMSSLSVHKYERK